LKTKFVLDNDYYFQVHGSKIVLFDAKDSPVLTFTTHQATSKFVLKDIEETTNIDAKTIRKTLAELTISFEAEKEKKPVNTSELTSLEAQAAKELGHTLHPAGGLAETFVYEPIGYNEYAYHTINGKKGIAQVQVEYEDPEKKRNPSWKLFVEGSPYYFVKKPPKQFLFALPDVETVEKWVRGEKPSKPLTDIWDLTQVYFRTFLDFPHPYEFSIATLFAIQSWLAELVPVVFYLMVRGEFGGGKSVSCEAIYPICRHGYETGNLSPPFVARTIETQKLTLYVDELDSVAGKKDSDLYSIFRQGYRRGGSYSRINPDTLEPESYRIFGAKLYTVHSEIEQALQTRTVPLHVRETADYEYPIANPEKAVFAENLHVEYFLWYLDNVLKLRDNEFEKFDALNVLNSNHFDTLDGLDVLNQGATNQNIKENVDKISSNIRKKIVNKKITLLEEHQVSQVKQVTGRNVELAYLCFMLAKIVDINLDEEIEKTFDQKLIEEGERTEIGYLGTLRDVLATVYHEKKDNKEYKTQTNEVMISNKELYTRFNRELKEEKLEGVSPHKFKEYLIEFGFTDAINRKKLEVPIPDGKKQSRLCNIFTARVIKKLDIKPDEEPPKPTFTILAEAKLGICELCSKPETLTHSFVLEKKTRYACSSCAKGDVSG